MREKFKRVQKFIKDNQGPIMLGAGAGVGALIVSQYPDFFLRKQANPLLEDATWYVNSTPEEVAQLFLEDGSLLVNCCAGHSLRVIATQQ